MSREFSGADHDENPLDRIEIKIESILDGDIIFRQNEARLQERELDASFWKDFQQKFQDALTLCEKPSFSMPGEHDRSSLPNVQYDVFALLPSDTDSEDVLVWKGKRIVIKELGAYVGRVSHLGVHTAALGDERLPRTTNFSEFFGAHERLVARMEASGELAAREKVYHKYIAEKVRLREDIAELYDLMIPGSARWGDLAELSQTYRQRHVRFLEEMQRATENYYRRLTEVGDSFWEKYERPKPVVSHRSPVRGLAPLESIIHFKSDNINNGAVSFLSRAVQSKPGEGFAYGLEHRYKDLVVTYGLPSGERADTLFALLAQSGAKMVKAHFALWGRWYEEGAKSGGFLNIPINQFCADLGYRPNKGAYRREHKQSAREILNAITSIEIQAIYTPPGKKPAQRLRGPIWSRGLIYEEDGQHDDLPGQTFEGEAKSWSTLNFSFAPGPWFFHEEWNYYNPAIGKISAGLMQLKNDKDEWAILIGGYLATMMRPAQYQPRRLRVVTILNRTGLAQSGDARRRVSELQGKFEHAMKRVVEVGVLNKWQYTVSPVEDLKDADDADAVAAYYADNALAPTDFRRRVVEVTSPMVDDAQRLAERSKKYKKVQNPERGKS